MHKLLRLFWQFWSRLDTVVVFAVAALLLLIFGVTYEAFLLAWLLLSTTIVVYTIKWKYPTKRPDHKKSIKKAKHFWQKVDLSTFPSAHAARAAALLLVSILALPWWMVVFSFIFLICTSYSRVVLKRHYWFDIFWGAVFGAVLGWFSWLLHMLTIDFFTSIISFLF